MEGQPSGMFFWVLILSWFLYFVMGYRRSGQKKGGSLLSRPDVAIAMLQKPTGAFSVMDKIARLVHKTFQKILFKQKNAK
ncbi:MAG: hypothetical protein KTR26_20030 [Flammeovirgaceae bacterium]|nr:hypothetical protein [Flammeovirgaceae bacterium]